MSARGTTAKVTSARRFAETVSKGVNAARVSREVQYEHARKFVEASKRNPVPQDTDA